MCVNVCECMCEGVYVATCVSLSLCVLVCMCVWASN